MSISLEQNLKYEEDNVDDEEDEDYDLFENKTEAVNVLENVLAPRKKGKGAAPSKKKSTPVSKKKGTSQQLQKSSVLPRETPTPEVFLTEFLQNFLKAHKFVTGNIANYLVMSDSEMSSTSLCTTHVASPGCE